MKQTSNQRSGKLGEDIATDYLRKGGYSILDRNFRAGYGEIDIIALKKNILVFVEVKTRSDTSFGTPEEAVTPRKLREVVQTAEYFKMLHTDLPEAMRVDVIGIQLTGKKITYFKHTQNVTL